MEDIQTKTMTSHTKDKPYNCETCGNPFQRNIIFLSICLFTVEINLIVVQLVESVFQRKVAFQDICLFIDLIDTGIMVEEHIQWKTFNLKL